MPWMRNVVPMAAVLGGALLVACERDPQSGCTPPEILTLGPNEPPRLVADSVGIGGRFYRITAFPWRDFQPVTTPAGDPLRVTVRLVAADSLSVPDSISIDRVAVLLGDRAWFSQVRSRRLDPPEAIEAVAACGPLWGPNVTVDVVAEMSTPSRRGILVAERGVEISRTD